MRYNEKNLCDMSGKVQIKIYHSTVSEGKRSFNPHHHTECELSLITEGSGIYSVKNKKYEFRKGDIFLFNSDEIHCITEVFGGKRFDVLNIHFEPRLLWSRDGFSSFELLKIFFSRSDIFENMIDRNNPASKKIVELILDAERELCDKKFEYPLAVKGKILEILLILSREYGYIDDSGGSKAYEHNAEQLASVISYIEGNLSSEIKLSQLAEICGMNKTYFCYIFKKYNGISPFDYITIKRIEKAVGLIKNTDRKKIDIASECGFNSMSNFYKAFTKITGKKPGDFNRQTSALKMN